MAWKSLIYQNIILNYKSNLMSAITAVDVSTWLLKLPLSNKTVLQ